MPSFFQPASMIRTIDDYRNVASSGPSTSNEPLAPGKDSFTIADAAHLKLKLQSLNNALLRTPLNQHHRLRLKDILQTPVPRTYINGSEEVYLLVEHLSWPALIPDIFVKAYGQALHSQHFTNTYKRIQWKKGFAPIFSAVRHLLPQLDALCGTRLYTFFQEANSKVKPFPFLRLPAELRLQVYDRLLPSFAFIPVHPWFYPDHIDRPPRGLDIMCVNKALHDEVAEHYYNKRALLINASRQFRNDSKDCPTCFTQYNATEYVQRITNIDHGIRSRFKRLEIQIMDEFIPNGVLPRSNSVERPDQTALQRICASLPNLQSIIISYYRYQVNPADVVNEDQRFTMASPQTPERSFHTPRRFALEWLRPQLSIAGPRIRWDLTNFRHPVNDAKQLRDAIRLERMMRELVERDGCLELAQSATANQKDLQRWANVRSMVLEAVKKA